MDVKPHDIALFWLIVTTDTPRKTYFKYGYSPGNYS